MRKVNPTTHLVAYPQVGGTEVDLFRPRVIFRPETVVPDFDLSVGANY